MNIVHVVESFAGGVYDFIYDLVVGMPQDTHTIIYARREHTPENFQEKFPENVEFIEWQYATRELSPVQDIKAYLQLVDTLKQLDVDIIHLHSSKAGFLGRLAARRVGLSNQTIYTAHGVSFLRQDVPAWKHRLFVYLEKIGAFFGGTVVGCSKSEAEAFHKNNIDATYINNGIKCMEYVENTTKTKSKICIGTIGRISYPKNPFLFNAIAEQFLDDEKVEFLWIGDGELKEQLKSNNIKSTGWLMREQVNNELKNIDIYLSTSLWEGLPLSVLQAMCTSKPLVLRECVGNKDLVNEDLNGRLFTTFNEGISALEELIRSEIKRKIMGKESLALAKKTFSIKQMVDNYKKLYEKL